MSRVDWRIDAMSHLERQTSSTRRGGNRLRQCVLALVGLWLWSSPAAAEYSLSAPTVYAPVDATRFTSAVAVGDVNGDQRADVLTLEHTQPGWQGDSVVVIRPQTADNKLAAPITLTLPQGSTNQLAVADINRDGLLDIVVGSLTGVVVFNSRSSAPGTFDRTSWDNFQRTTSMAVIDSNGDGNLDVACDDGLEGILPVAILYGDGEGGLLGSQLLSVETKALGLSAGDINRDGLPDLLLRRPSDTSLGVLYRDPTLGYPHQVIFNFGEFLIDSTLGDINGDGRLDIIAIPSGQSRLDVTFQVPARQHYLSLGWLASAASPTRLSSMDIDGDGRDDLLVAHPLPVAALGLYLQGPAGLRPEKLSALPIGGYYRESNIFGIAAADLDGDGCRDIALADFYQGLVVLKGLGCAPADLSVAIASGTSNASVGIANASNVTGSAKTPFVVVDLWMRSGRLNLGSIPNGCAVVSQSAARARISCSIPTLAPGESNAITVPLSPVATTARGLLNIVARASTDTTEIKWGNNVASKQIRISP